MTILETCGLTVQIGEILVCDNLDISIPEEAVVGILGANGTGKTTLLHTLAGLRPPHKGVVKLQDQLISDYSARQRAQVLGILLQDHQDPLYASVLQTVLSGRHPYHSALEQENEQDYDIAWQALKLTQLDTKAEQAAHQLSGGEKKRMDLATLLTQNPRVYLLDEPNSHLDIQFQISLLKLVSDRARQRLGTAIMVLHDVNLTLRFCEYVLLLYGNGEVQFGLCNDLINSQNLQRLFGHHMIEAQHQHQRLFFPG
ncbi:MAG: iron complex transport system ATP-binding protein [Parasphingorhabdus sp.]|jgi:iron complex transport system ATP-binding protein